MKLKTASMSDEKHKALSELSKFWFYPTELDYLGAHRGYRPGLMHLCLAPASGGKSTLVRSKLIDIVKCALAEDENCLLWLTEEKRQDFQMELANIAASGSPLAKKFDKIKIISEMDRELQENWEEQFFEAALTYNARFLVIDNITTSDIYASKRVPEQDEVAKKIKLLGAKTKMAIIVFAHTGASVKHNADSLIDQNDIRGSKTIVNLAEYLYILQQIRINKDIFSTIRITKHRGQTVKDSLFSLNYNASARIYTESPSIDFEEFKKLYSDRNKLR